MKKSILNLGKTLNKVEQKSINGGGLTYCPKECERGCYTVFEKGRIIYYCKENFAE